MKDSDDDSNKLMSFNVALFPIWGSCVKWMLSDDFDTTDVLCMW